MIRSKTATTSVEFDEEDVLAFFEEADVLQKLHIIKVVVDKMTLEEFDRLEEFFTNGSQEDQQDLYGHVKAMRLFRLFKQLKVGLDSIR